MCSDALKLGQEKTAAFLLPMLQKLTAEPRPNRRVIRSLVLSPTRELAAQIGDSFASYAHLPAPTQRHLWRCQAGPTGSTAASGNRRADRHSRGRLLDLHGQGFIDFSSVSFFVLDEADRMLDIWLSPRHPSGAGAASCAASEPAVLGDNARQHRAAGQWFSDRSRSS